MAKQFIGTITALSCAAYVATLGANGFALFVKDDRHSLQVTRTIAVGLERRERDVRLCISGRWTKGPRRPGSERPTTWTEWDRAGIAGSRTRWANGEWSGGLRVSYLYPLLGSAILPCAWLWRRWRRARPGTAGWRPLLWAAAAVCLGGVAAYGITWASAFDSSPGQTASAPPTPVTPPTPGEPWTVPRLGLELVWIGPGSLQMGSNDGADEKPVHPVRISRGFWLGRYEVSRAEYQAVTGWNESYYQVQGLCRPVENVSWDDAVAFCARLTEREKGRLPEGYEYRLPTEAEWEYACRAGSASRYSFGVNESALGEYAWGPGNSEGRTHAVGTGEANAWGLYDMHGNVWEWCLDRYDPDYYGRSPAVDPVNTASASCHVIRGGGWGGLPAELRSASRLGVRPGDSDNWLGFRACLAPQAGGEIRKELSPLSLDDEFRLRTQKRIEALRKESLDDLMETICLEKGYKPPEAFTSGGDSLARLDVHVVLSNRRYARIRQMLKELPPDKASAVCRTLLRQTRERRADTIARTLRFYDVPGSPRNTVSGQGNKWGMCAGILLASEFCDTTTVLDAIGEAEKAESGWFAAVNAKPDVYPAGLAGAIEHLNSLQTTFKLVALSLAAHHDEAISKATRNRLDELLAAMEAGTVQSVSWEAGVTRSDDAHGALVDVSKGVEDIKIYTMSFDQLRDHAWQQNLLERVRQLLTAEIRQHAEGHTVP